MPWPIRCGEGPPTWSTEQWGSVRAHAGQLSGWSAATARPRCIKPILGRRDKGYPLGDTHGVVAQIRYNISLPCRSRVQRRCHVARRAASPLLAVDVLPGSSARHGAVSRPLCVKMPDKSVRRQHDAEDMMLAEWGDASCSFADTAATRVPHGRPRHGPGQIRFAVMSK